MDERTIMIAERLSGDYSIAEIARRRGVSRKTVYKWLERYERDPSSGLLDHSRAARHHANAISPQMEERILEWKAQKPLWGAPKIHSKLRDLPDCPCEATVGNVLQRHGLTRQARRRAARATPSPGPLGPSGGCNQVWCADFKGWFRTGDGQRCDTLTVSDSYSRYVLCCQAMSGSTGMKMVQPVCERVFREYGIPRVIRTDNGAPFASAGLAGLSSLSVWWLKLGIGLERIQPGHPEQNGGHERFHRTLKEGALNPPRPTLHTQQKAFDTFCREYNDERPHEALNQNPPARVYEPSRRDFPSRLLEPEYAEHWVKRRVRTNGEIRWEGAKLYVSQALVGEWVGLEAVEERVWKIHFMNQALGWLDEQRGCVRALQNKPRRRSR